MRNENITLTRGQIGLWASFIGVASLIIALISWLWQGSISSLTIGLFIVAAIGIGLWAIMTPQEFVGFFTGRQARYSTTAVLSTFLLIGIIVLVYIVTQRAVLTLDMTQAQLFTLSPESRSILRGVTRPIRITGFYSAAALRLQETDDQFFRLYSAETNDMISREYINPNDQPALAQRYGAVTDGTVYLSYLDENGAVDFNTLMLVPRQAGGAQEREMTQALARLLIAGTLKVYFDNSHGQLDPLDNSQQGLSAIHQGIQSNGLLTESIDLFTLAEQGRPIPGDAAAIMLIRPTEDFSPAVIQLLDDYLQSGGGVFITVDAPFGDTPFMTLNSPFNQYLWDTWGIRTLDAVLVDEAASLRTPLDIIGAAVFTGTDIGARLDPEQSPTLFRLARALELNTENPPVNNGQVLATSPISYGETDLQRLATTNEFTFNADEDIQGPLTIVAWAWDQNTNGKVLLVGDSDFLTNGYITSAMGNAILFTDGLSWLTELNKTIAFAPQQFSSGLPLIVINAQMRDMIAIFTTLIMPGLTLVIGLGVWARRNRR